MHAKFILSVAYLLYKHFRFNCSFTSKNIFTECQFCPFFILLVKQTANYLVGQERRSLQLRQVETSSDHAPCRFQRQLIECLDLNVDTKFWAVTILWYQLLNLQQCNCLQVPSGRYLHHCHNSPSELSVLSLCPTPSISLIWFWVNTRCSKFLTAWEISPMRITLKKVIARNIHDVSLTCAGTNATVWCCRLRHL